jgi:hypothetical protein
MGADQLYAGDRVVALAMRDDVVSSSYTSEFGQPVSVLPAVTSVAIKSSLGGSSYSVPVNSRDQLRTIPMGAADTVVVGFNQEVSISQSHVSVIGGKGAGTTYAITYFNYDPNTFTATVRFDNDSNPATPLVVPDRLVVEDDVKDASGNKLDGEWVNPTSVDPGVPQSGLATAMAARTSTARTTWTSPTSATTRPISGSTTSTGSWGRPAGLSCHDHPLDRFR